VDPPWEAASLRIVPSAHVGLGGPKTALSAGTTLEGTSGPLGYALWHTQREFAVVESGATRIAQAGVERYQHVELGRRSWNLYAVTGLRAALVPDLPLAIPVGIRLQKREVIPSKYTGSYEEYWFQARSLVLPRDSTLGVDVAMALPWAALSVYGEVLPRLGSGTPSCDPLGRACQPPYRATSFNMVPGSRQILVGLGIRLYFAESRN